MFAEKPHVAIGPEAIYAGPVPNRLARRRVLLALPLVMLLPVLGLGVSPASAGTATGRSSVGIGVAVPEPSGRTAHASSGSVTAAYGVQIEIYGFSSAVEGGRSSLSDMGGSVYLQRRMPGGSWTDIAGPKPGGGAFPDQPTTEGNASYRMRFTGGRTTAGGTTTTYPPAYSSVVRLVVKRRVRVKRPVVHDDAVAETVKVVPSLAGRKVTLQVKRHHQWGRFARVRLDQRSKVRLTFPASARGVRYNVVVPGDEHFSSSRFPFRATLPTA